MRVLKFDFLLLFCYILFELPAQLKELRRCEEKYCLKYFIYLFILERGEGREEGRERNMDAQEKHR